MTLCFVIVQWSPLPTGDSQQLRLQWRGAGSCLLLPIRELERGGARRRNGSQESQWNKMGEQLLFLLKRQAWRSTGCVIAKGRWTSFPICKTSVTIFLLFFKNKKIKIFTEWFSSSSRPFFNLLNVLFSATRFTWYHLPCVLVAGWGWTSRLSSEWE